MDQSIVVDFSILNLTDPDPRVLLIADNSKWSVIYDKPSIIEIVTPGMKEPITQFFQKDKINSFNSSTLYLSCYKDNHTLYDLPDGFYKITVKGSPDKYMACKHYMRTTKLTYLLDRLFIRLNPDTSPIYKEYVEELEYIRILLYAAEANVRNGNIMKANSQYSLATKLAESLESKDCNS